MDQGEHLFRFWLNGGGGQEWSLVSITLYWQNTGLFPVDMNGDGHLDLLGMSWEGEDILWWESL
ncbi:MAG: FG-GAP repeat domain-containing protein, partial [Candidatus Promineifilaceae bacterium]